MLEGFKTKSFNITKQGDVLNSECENETLRELFATINNEMGATKFSSKPLPSQEPAFPTSYLICEKLWVRKMNAKIMKAFSPCGIKNDDVVIYDVEVYYKED